MEEQNAQKTPEWLRRLEEESWQAELIISGLALYGSLQLPGFIYVVIDFFIRNLPIEQYLTGYGITYALLLGVSILSGFFIIHFVLRAYWVGLIGMNSVFPNGYNSEGGFYSKIYVEKFTSLLPKVPDTIQKVDKICSTLFAGAFAFLMVYGMMGMVLSLLLLVYNLLLNIASPEILNPIYSAIGILFIVFLIFGMIANLDRFKQNEKVQNAYFIGAKYFGYFMSAIFFKPINQITMTFLSGYEKGKSNIGLMTAFFAIAISLSFTHVKNSNIKILMKKSKDDFTFFQKNRIYPEFYEDTHSAKKGIMNPVIPAEQIKGDFLKIFIPVFDNEEFIWDSMCKQYIPDESKDRFENRRLKSEQRVFCYRKYHQIFVNDSLYRVEFLRHEHSHDTEFGILGYLPTDSFLKGKNELRVVKLENSEGKIYDQLTIPFWFSH